jgi:hypothetical protein
VDLVRLPVHIHNDAVGTPEVIGKNIERGHGQAAAEHGETPGSRLQGCFDIGFTERHNILAGILDSLEKFLKPGVQTHRHETVGQSLIGRERRDIGKRFEDSGRPGQEMTQLEIEGVFQKDVVLIGLHVLAFDILVRRM